MVRKQLIRKVYMVFDLIGIISPVICYIAAIFIMRKHQRRINATRIRKVSSNEEVAALQLRDISRQMTQLGKGIILSMLALYSPFLISIPVKMAFRYQYYISYICGRFHPRNNQIRERS